MDADEHVLLSAHLALDDGEVAFIVEPVLECMNAKMPVLAWKIDVCHLTHKVFRTLAILDDRLYRDDVKPMFLRKFLELRRAHHMPVLVHDLTA